MNDQPTISPIASNRTLGQRFFAAQDSLRGGPDPELCSADYRAWLGGNPAVDRRGHEGFARAFYAAFPDIRHELELVLADEQGVAVRARLKGRHTQAFFGIPATSASIDVVLNVFLRIQDGKVSELFGVFDEAGLLRQLGALPRG